MLDRAVVEEFIDYEFEDSDWEIPVDISKSAPAETFCKFTEDDPGEWLNDNFKSFFNNDPDRDWIRGRIEYYKNQ